MADAGYSSVIEVSTDDSTWNVVGGCNSVTFPRSRAELDATDFSDTAMQRIVGLKDTSCSLSGDYDNADSGIGDIETQFASGGDCYVRFKPDGTNGYKFQGLVTSFEITSSPDGKVEFSCEVLGNDPSGWSSV